MASGRSLDSGARGRPLTRPSVRRRGVVQRLMLDRGYGFIRCLEGSEGEQGVDYFMHRGSLEDCDLTDLREGTLVDFEPTLVAKGPRAEHVRKAET
jgi:cold shock CspA family protein